MKETAAAKTPIRDWDSHFTASSEVKRITSFLRRKVAESKANGVVLGLSGGIDSAVVSSLCTRAIGPSKVTGIFLFENANRRSKDYKDARALADLLHVKTMDIRISPAISTLARILAPSMPSVSRLTLGNIKARTRMIILYSVANQKGLLVAGTGDRSEALLGYFTKYGDGAADVMPIAHLFKSEVRSLGAYLGLPLEIISKPSTPNLWKGQMATDELPADYDVLDPVLHMLFDQGKSTLEASRLSGVSQRVIRKILQRYRSSTHKREMPMTLGV